LAAAVAVKIFKIEDFIANRQLPTANYRRQPPTVFEFCIGKVVSYRLYHFPFSF